MNKSFRSNLRGISRVLNILGIVMLATGFLVTTINQPAQAANEDKITICHAAGQEGTLQFTTLELPYVAVYGQAGHFNEDGTTQAGHENDYLGPCLVEATETPTSTATNTPTNTPTTPTNTATNTPTNTPIPPTNTPTNTPTSTGTLIPTNTPTNTQVPTETPTQVSTPDPTDPPTVVNTLPPPQATTEVLIPVTGADLSAFNGSRAGRAMMNLGSLLLGLGLVLNGVSRKQ